MFYMNLTRGLISIQGAALDEYNKKLSTLGVDLDSEIARIQKLELSSSKPVEMMKSGVRVRARLIELKRSDMDKQRAEAARFYGVSPFDKELRHFIPFVNSKKYKGTDPLREFGTSWHAAYQVKLREAEIARLEEQISVLEQKIQQAEIESLEENARQAIRAANTYRHALSVASIAPLIVAAAGASVAVQTAALRGSIRAGIAGLGGSLAAPLVAGVAALLYPSSLGNGERQEKYLLSMPLADLKLELDGPAQAAALVRGAVDLPLRMGFRSEVDGQAELFVTQFAGFSPSVRVLAAQFDAGIGGYSVAVGDDVSSTLVWTPAVTPPGNSNTSPVTPPSPSVLAGPTLEAIEGRLDEYPELADVGFDDYVIIFPADSGLPPLYVVFKNLRYLPGVGSGNGSVVDGTYLVEGNEKGAGVPVQIANNLRGRRFSSFNSFRKAFWRLVAEDPVLSLQFDRLALASMKAGLAPPAPKSEWVGERGKYEIHHEVRISDGGAVYDVDNLVILSPKFHLLKHKGSKGL
ncbi:MULTISPECIES: S-type pyocin domain-containing protein [Pseudomonas]|nr:S-type pyocin domain-containing protein [Pseudomonas mosselii]